MKSENQNASDHEAQLQDKLESLLQDEDSLLACLGWLFSFHGKNLSKTALLGGGGRKGTQLTPAELIDIADKNGFRAKVIKRSLNNLATALFPVILITKDERAVLLTEKQGQSYKVRMVETNFEVTEQTLSELNDQISGYVILCRPHHALSEDRRAAAKINYQNWFWGTLQQNWWTYLQVGLAAIFINLFALASPFFTMIVYDRVVPNQAIDTLWVLATGVSLVILFDFVLKTLRAWFIDHAGKKADIVIACKIFDKVLDMRLASRPSSAGAFANSLREFESLRDFFTSATLVTLVDLPFALLFIGVLWLINPNMATIMGIAAMAIIVWGMIVQFPLSFSVKRHFRETAQRHGTLIETINGLETIKTAGAQGRVRQSWQTAVGLTAKSNVTTRNWAASAGHVTQAVQQIANVSLILMGVYLIGLGELSIGALIASVMLSGRTLAPLGQVAQLLTRFHQSRSALQALNKIMAEPVERPPHIEFISTERLSGKITCKTVGFTYPEAKQPALTNLNFTIKQGEKIAIIGAVGSGKSTLLRLLDGLYLPNEGDILLDNIDLRQIDPLDIRRDTGFMGQDPFLFSGSIGENITIGWPEAPIESLKLAAERAGISHYINQLPAGFDHQVGERGEGLSGGQRQGIALARALIRQPPILLLDEPSAQLDRKSEQLMIANLERLDYPHSLILTTHRSSLLRLVSRIIVMDKGRIIMDGPKQQVLENLSNKQGQGDG